MPLRLIEGDITAQAVDAVVNAANSTLLGGRGVDGAIHAKGGPAILAECRRLRQTRLPDGLPAGQAVATTAGVLSARWVIHTVGPVFSRREDRSALLHSCYRASLEMALQLGARSIAFPLISAGAYGWPISDAVTIALAELRAAPAQLDVRLVLFGERIFDIARQAWDRPLDAAPSA
ncbi:MAG: O-acetyl-ADP-ribose deacetylase [Actinobacteria bacterium]|nr:O-acetyl-ADP-ribose deacetylase [Actinomycetota bacterium]